MTGLAAAPANAHSNVQIINETQHAIVEGIPGRDVLPVGQPVKHQLRRRRGTGAQRLDVCRIGTYCYAEG